MLLVGLTGGIGSGKSTVATLLAARGAVISDADVAARVVMAPGGAAYDGVAARFPAVVTPDGGVDRAALAAVVFADPAARADLEALVHPAIRAVMAAEVADQEGTDHVVVVVVPLLVETGGPWPGSAATIVVDCPPDVAARRLVAKGMTPLQVAGRMAAQADRRSRLALADHVVDNGGDLVRLAAGVEQCWAWLATLDTDRSQ
ncbi:MAG: dephospho-CoA kinase [Acidimicrobiales bacterium]